MPKGVIKIGMMAVLLCACATLQSDAQSQNIQQSGTVTAGHVFCVLYNGVAQDCGTANVANATEFGVTKNGGQPFCVSDTKVRTGQYNQLCFGITSAGSANIYATGYNGAVDSLTVWINGVPYPFPSSVPYTASPLRTVSSGTTDTANTPDQNGTIAWNSNSASPKTETLFSCTSGLNGFNVTVKDEYGSAGTYPITVTSASNIDGQSTYIMAFNYQSIKFQCDGTSTHWVAL